MAAICLGLNVLMDAGSDSHSDTEVMNLMAE